MIERTVRIEGMGTYLPETKVTSAMLDEKLGLPIGTIEEKTGMRSRRYVTDESSSQMGAIAARRALKESGLDPRELDCIVSCSGVGQQPIPCTASLIQEQLGLQGTGIPCFDINATCMSFITGFDIMSHLIHNGQYGRALLVAADISSVGINYQHLESSALFGDGAVAAVLTKGDGHSRVLCSSMRTYSEGAHLTEIRGGGNALPGYRHTDEHHEDFLFHMDGPAVFKLALRTIEGFIDEALAPTGKDLEGNLPDIAMVIPHQASPSSLALLRRKLGIPEEKFLNIVQDYGNMIAASVPLALHEAVKTGKLHRGDRALLFGAGAGMSFGAILLDY